MKGTDIARITKQSNIIIIIRYSKYKKIVNNQVLLQFLLLGFQREFVICFNSSIHSVLDSLFRLY